MKSNTDIYQLRVKVLTENLYFEDCLKQVERNIEEIEKVIDKCNLDCSPIYSKFAKIAAEKLNNRVVKFIAKYKMSTSNAIIEEDYENLSKILTKRNSLKDYNHLKNAINLYEKLRQEDAGYRKSTKFYLSIFGTFKYLLKELIRTNNLIAESIKILNEPETFLEY